MHTSIPGIDSGSLWVIKIVFRRVKHSSMHIEEQKFGGFAVDGSEGVNAPVKLSKFNTGSFAQ